MWFDPAELLKNAASPAATLAIPATLADEPMQDDDSGPVAILAIPATLSAWTNGERAKIAEVAKIAAPPEVKPAKAATSWQWLVHYADRDPVTVACLPEQTHAEILAMHPDAIAAQPYSPTVSKPSAPMTADQEAQLRTWLVLAGETDVEIIEDLLLRCRADEDARRYHLALANRGVDDLRVCSSCRNFNRRGICTIAKMVKGALVMARAGFQPVPNVAHRCDGFEARPVPST